MDKQKIKGVNFPKDVFLVKDKNNHYHWYNADPMKADHRDEHEINIEESIMDLVGKGDVTNPIVVKLVCARITRSEPFNLAQPAEVRRGDGMRHFEDLTGSVVEILEVRNSSPGYPLSAVVFNRMGDVVGNRRYSLTGECEDGEDDHTIVLVNRPAKFETEVKPSEDAGTGA